MDFQYANLRTNSSVVEQTMSYIYRIIWMERHLKELAEIYQTRDLKYLHNFFPHIAHAQKTFLSGVIPQNILELSLN
jgi:hypothetical protein